MIVVSVAPSILMFCVVSVPYCIISYLRFIYLFFLHFSELKAGACLKVSVLFFTFWKSQET